MTRYILLTLIQAATPTDGGCGSACTRNAPEDTASAARGEGR